MIAEPVAEGVEATGRQPEPPESLKEPELAPGTMVPVASGWRQVLALVFR